MRPNPMFLRVLVALSFVWMLAGCYQIDQVINVKPDGSGTLVITTKIGKAGQEQIKANADGKEFTDEELLDQIFSKKQFEQKVPSLGEGVKLEGITFLKEGEFIGRVATLSFADITKVTPHLNIGAGDGEDAQSKVRFEFKKGDPATLTAHLPGKRDEEVKPDKPGEEAQFAQIAPLLKDMRMTLAVNVEGTLVKSDAAFAEGNRSVLLDAKMAGVFADFKRFKAISSAKTWPEAAKLMNAIAGVRMEPKEKVEIQLR